MKLVAVGQEPVGFLAVGQVATGVIAIGQVATGVVALGQVARGVVAVGQLAVGVVSFGQVGVGMLWSAGLLGLAPVTPGWSTSPALAAKLGLRDLVRGRWRRVEWRRRTGGRAVLAALGVVAAAAVVVGVALLPLLDDLTRVGGILREAPRPLG